MTSAFPDTTASGPCPRPSTLIAEALVERQSARQIVARAYGLGLPDPTVEVILAACGSTAGLSDGAVMAQTDHD